MRVGLGYLLALAYVFPPASIATPAAAAPWARSSSSQAGSSAQSASSAPANTGKKKNKNSKFVFGGTYAQLGPEQRKLVDDWIAAYNHRTGQDLKPEAYNALPISTRTTFEAVTHALLTTRLTNQKNQHLGNALQLVQAVEAVKGKVPGARGDLQFRIYVTLTPDAIRILDECVQFNRKGDNTVFHNGYPVNMRQGGGFPSIQISSNREGTRADIDVDYRSAGFPAGLVNGHLTAANSDIRAGSNYGRHTRRWSGLGNWWANVFGIPVEDDSRWSPPAEVDIASKPAMTAVLPLEAVAADFLSKWLLEKKPNLAVAYFAPRSYACFTSGETAKAAHDPVPRPLWKAMTETDSVLGEDATLSEAVERVDLSALGLTPQSDNQDAPFTVAKLPVEIARKLDCAPANAGELPRTDYYAVSFRIKVPGAATGSNVFVWTRTDGYWRIIAVQNDVELLGPGAVPENFAIEGVESQGKDLASTPRTAATPAQSADPRMLEKQAAFLNDLFVAKNSEAAFDAFAPSSYSCVNRYLGNDQQAAKTAVEAAGDLRTDLQELAERAPKGASLDQVIEAFQPDNPTLLPVAHPNESAYLLVQVPDVEIASFLCKLRPKGAAATSQQSAGAANSGAPSTPPGPYYGTFLRIIEPGDDTGALGLLWAKHNGEWKIVAYGIDEP